MCSIKKRTTNILINKKPEKSREKNYKLSFLQCASYAGMGRAKGKVFRAILSKNNLCALNQGIA